MAAQRRSLTDCVSSACRLAPIPFYENFIANAMSNTASNSVQLFQGIESEQTALQLFCQCTVHKLTHLYASDVMAANGDIDDTAVFPVKWDCWKSPMTRQFHQMLDSFLSSLTR